MRIGLMGVLLVLLSACAGTGTNDVTVAQASEKVCTREVPIGSTIPVTKCRSREEIEASRSGANQTADAVRSAPNVLIDSQRGK